MNADIIPVIVATAEITDPPKAIMKARDPLTLMVDVARLADKTGGGHWLRALDSLDIVNPASWAYADLPAQLSDALSVSPRHAALSPTGGETPIKLIHQAASRIAAGHASVALIVGAEAQYSVNSAARSGEALPWPEKIKTVPDYMAVAAHLEPRAMQLGLFFPSHVYPFYDAASAHSWGQSPAQAQNESGTLWARYNQVALDNPQAWNPKPMTAQQIITPSPANRFIAWPYTKAQVANPSVNQAAAVIATNLTTARAMGVSEDDIVFIGRGAYADAPRNFMARESFARNHAQEAVLNAVAGDYDALELYSCFPVVPKMARRILGLSADVMPTVTGGLSFFGAPLNNYMTHSVCAMTRAIKGGVERGLVYGQGEFVTKHHALSLSKRPEDFIPYDRARVPHEHGTIPPFDPDATGAATVETFTISYNRDGSMAHGIVVAMTDASTRTLAKVDAENVDILAQLTDMTRFPIGRSGTLMPGKDGVPRWDFAGPT